MVFRSTIHPGEDIPGRHEVCRYMALLSSPLPSVNPSSRVIDLARSQPPILHSAQDDIS
jgi:hypothetical protein